MNQDKLFEGIGDNNQTLWERLQLYSDELDLQPEDSKIFVSDEQATLSFYINNYMNGLISVGVHLARVRKVRNILENKRARIFGDLYVIETDKCVSGGNSSKYDKEYRTGKVTSNKEYRELLTLIADVSELEAILDSTKLAYQTKATVLPTMFKLDRTQY